MISLPELCSLDQASHNQHISKIHTLVSDFVLYLITETSVMAVLCKIGILILYKDYYSNSDIFYVIFSQQSS